MEKHLFFGYFWAMRRWFCTFMLLVFSLTMGLSGGGLPASLKARTATADQVVSAHDTASAHSRCCMNEQINGRSGTSRCLSDCSFSIANVPPLVIPVARIRAVMSAGDIRSRYAGAVFRPPIA
ncbi:MAG: hypothetical protein NXI27_13510 [Alphaproteobacteria bacterium]|nr:hypothetical protein [Alphaproteobacteria bacterium]